jgi:hypothetical protein
MFSLENRNRDFSTSRVDFSPLAASTRGAIHGLVNQLEYPHRRPGSRTLSGRRTPPVGKVPYPTRSR